MLQNIFEEIPGALTAVTFNTVSTTSSDYKTVTAESGNDPAISANVVVVEVQKLQYRFDEEDSFVDAPFYMNISLGPIC